MNPWFAKFTILAAAIVMVVVRAPHGTRSRERKVIESRKGGLETFLLVIAWIAFFLPLVWIAIPRFSFADFTLYPLPYGVGVLILAGSLWLLHRSHVELGTNWSITLEIGADQTLASDGVYRYIRHPMYSSLLLYGVGQVFVVPNRIVGPSCLSAMILLVSLRLVPEETMLRDRFNAAYDQYVARTKRLIPGVW